MQRVKRLLPLLACLILMLSLNACLSFHRQAVFFPEDQRLIMEGVIDSYTPKRLAEVLERNPQITTIVLLDVEGSVDDEANFVAARLVREKGLATHVPANGVIASGGTDFFLAGVKRTIEPGAQIGVHSWAEGFGKAELQGGDLAKDHPDHQIYLEYYRDMNIPESFYWFTLEAAPAEGMHWMSREEMEQYGFLTEKP
ncbi:COG3904 family protein [Acanthopleuribacter pedis]|uniref:Hydrolase n=1 Tax=Acanthopleuribacter pedis TaxID=442870 RepID=A0A8J7Q8I5_9BACT|nr:hypothetical protein [Acanthopleuribacter pedis]MBO1320461.1 hypothetical protein [Acanthopleuribacter pedis]